MTNNDRILQLIKHDGWQGVVASESMITYYHPESNTRGGIYKRACSVPVGDRLGDYQVLRPYFTDIRILHRMSLAIVQDLISLYSEEDSAFDFEHDMKVTDVKGKIVSAMFKDKNQDGEYIDLATSLVEAIQFINQHKPNDQTGSDRIPTP
jgi:hypothetical protein